MSTLGSRLERFIADCAAKAYTEPQEAIVHHHAPISRTAWERVRHFLQPTEGKSVLDIGCADGFAMRMFMEEGFAEATGITCSREDAHEANERGMRNVCVLDMHEIGDLRDEFVPQKVGELDLVWARHVLEHSPIPLFVLQEIHSILRPGTGKLYVEVPDPATACHHCANVQHFSCFGREGWEGLFDKAGFTPLDTFVFNVQVKAGDDRYFCWLLGLK